VTFALDHLVDSPAIARNPVHDANIASVRGDATAAEKQIAANDLSAKVVAMTQTFSRSAQDKEAAN
jgi:hypothetical protein